MNSCGTSSTVDNVTLFLLSILRQMVNLAILDANGVLHCNIGNTFWDAALQMGAPHREQFRYFPPADFW
jgi:hypothetical protein